MERDIERNIPADDLARPADSVTQSDIIGWMSEITGRAEARGRTGERSADYVKLNGARICSKSQHQEPHLAYITRRAAKNESLPTGFIAKVLQRLDALSAFTTALAPIMVLIVVGYGLKRAGFLSEETWSGMEKLTYFVLSPALLIRTLGSQTLAGTPWPAMLVVVTGTLIMSAVVLILLHRIRALDMTLRLIV